MKTHRKQGSGLFLVLIISTALGIGIYSTLSLVNGEFRRNKKAAVFHEAKQAAESLLQSGMADLKSRFENQTAFPIKALSPTHNPLYVSDEFVNIHEDQDSHSHLIIPDKKKYSSPDDFNTEATEIIGGQIPPGEWRFIDRNIPGNEGDELAGTRVFERNIEMVSKATVDRPSVGRSTVYARQFLQVRDAPLFAYAIFYNVPLEIAPGPIMHIWGGGVHSNGDSWFQAGNSLNIHTKVTLAGHMYHGRHPDTNAAGSNGAINIIDGSGSLVNMKKDGSWPSDTSSFGGGWLTSDAANFYDISNQIWDRNVQTADHGVAPQNPVGVSEYIEDTDPSTDSKESFNSAYNLIQPVLDETELAIPNESDDPAGYAKAKKTNEIEEQKFAYKAGLVIEVDDTAGTVNYFTYERESDGKIKYASDGTPKQVPLVPKENIATPENYTETSDGKNVVKGIHDKRQAQDLNLVEIDVSKLKDLVHDNDKDDWGSDDKQAPKKWWNGVVYVDFPQQNASSTRDDNVNPAKSGWGVKVVKGDVIPNPSFGHGEDIYGMTLATNQMMYVEGNYNADGNIGSGSPTEPDDPDTFSDQGSEAPAALVADSITFLSTNWNDSKSSHSLSKRKAKNTEISAAILTGLVPSGASGSKSYSGGVENFPRFLENWGGKTIQIRGSIVALFRSEVGTRRWGHSDVYSAPNRQWGFHEKFGEGYLPPGTPNTRSYRGIDFQLLNQEEYNTHVTRIKGYY